MNDTIADQMVHQHVRMLRVGAAFASDVRQRVGAIGTQLIQLLHRHDPALPTRLSTRLRHVDTVVDESAPLMRTAYRELATESLDTIVQAALTDLERIATSVNETADVPLLQNIPEASSLREILRTAPFPSADLATIPSATLPEWWARQSGAMGQKVADTLRVGVRQEDTLSQLIARLRGTAKHNFEDGVIALSQRNAEAVALTAMSAGANQGRVALWDANSEVIKGIVHVSTLDNRTTRVCIARSGLIYSVPEHKPMGHSVPYLGGIPYHWKCRSTFNPVFHRYADLIGAKGTRFDRALDALPESTRLAMDGRVPASVTFSEWLTRQPEAVQTQLLGATRRKLWQDGKFTLPQLLDQVTGRPLRIEEL